MASKRFSTTYDPASLEPFRISRSKLDLFSECPRCAFLDLKFGVKRPSGPAFTLNVAVDELLKREFDAHRAQKSAHPWMAAYGIDAVPFDHEKLDEWRDSLRRGIAYHHEPSNIIVRGGIDDVWATPSGELIIVDYKATAKKIGPSTEEDLYDSYKRQMEIYQWLFRRNGFTVSPIGYFVYVNGKADAKAFDGKLEFDVALIPYAGSDAWIEGRLLELRAMLESDDIPDYGRGTAFGGKDCEFCVYRENAGKTMRDVAARNKSKEGPRSLIV